MRLGIGWHFFKEGAKKFQGAGIPTAIFLQNAQGPLAGFYRSRIPDADGRERLDKKKTTAFWADYGNQVSVHYGFDQAQSKRVAETLELFNKRLDEFHASNGAEIAVYFLECDRLQNARQDKMKRVSFIREWIASKELELRGTARPWLSSLALMDQQLQSRLNAIANESQRQNGPCAIENRTAMLEDKVVKYVVIGVGILLVVGLFTRFASVVGILFLLSVMSTQPPWVMSANTTYVYYQMVEILALLVLVAFAAGRFAGLDYVIYGLRLRCCPPKTFEV